jgi:hypothetical protein
VIRPNAQSAIIVQKPLTCSSAPEMERPAYNVPVPTAVVACSGRVSPKSSSRKSVQASQRRRPAARRQPPRTGRLREPQLGAAYDAFIEPMRTLADPAKVSDAFDAEGIASVLIGQVLPAGLAGDRLVNAMLDVVDELARGGLAHAYLALRTLAVVGPPEIFEPAMRAADRMAAGADCPGSSTAWVAQLGQITSGACAMLADPYGETQTLLCEFAYADGARAHGVLATVDAAWHGGLAALTIVDEPDLVRRQLARRARREDTTVREIPAPEAGQRLLAGIDAFLRHGRPPEMDREDGVYGELCDSLSIARHRARTLVGSADQPPVADDVAARWPQDVRQQIAAEFLA